MTKCALPDASVKTEVIEPSVEKLVMLIARITATPRMIPNVVKSVREGRKRKLRNAIENIRAI
jgi:hypothetical protein